MEILEPTTITVTFDSTCRMEVGTASPDSVPTVLMSALGSWLNRPQMDYFEVLKAVRTQEDLLQALRLLRQTDGHA